LAEQENGTEQDERAGEPSVELTEEVLEKYFGQLY
jgi:hypothetical protein